MTAVIALDAVRPCLAPDLPDNDVEASPHIDVNDGALGCALRAIGALLRPASDDASAQAAIELLRELMPTAPGEPCPEVAIRICDVGERTELHARENLGDSEWLPLAEIPVYANSGGGDLHMNRRHLSLSSARSLVAVWVAFADRPWLLY